MTKRRNDRRWRNLRAAILAHSDICWLCGQPGADTVDHVIEVAQGIDPYDPTNLRPAHGARRPGCTGNYSRGATFGNQRREPRTNDVSRTW